MAEAAQAFTAAEEAAGRRRVAGRRAARVVVVVSAWVGGVAGAGVAVVAGARRLTGWAGTVRPPRVSLPHLPPGLGVVGVVAAAAALPGLALGGWPRAVVWGVLAGAAAWGVLHIIVPQVAALAAVMGGLQGLGAGG